ncbi:MAG: carbamoyltransferase HypF, partial [Candidatus Omnitrophica bacterium]|nr:carbamoyltransferase HypF [Candidatus Omnitrophota bacterium]
TRPEMLLIKDMLSKNIHAPWTSSAGRLFDAIAAILGICHVQHFEAQAAMELEFALSGITTNCHYSICISRFEESKKMLKNHEVPAFIVDWELMVREILTDLHWGIPAPEISARFHNTMTAVIVEVARRIGEEKVVLSGGCFQNKYLLERTIDRLRQEGFRPYWHQRFPSNDGGIALGQIIAALKS